MACGCATAYPRRSRRRKPHAPRATPPTASDDGRDDPDRIPLAQHREAVVGREGEGMDRFRELGRRGQGCRGTTSDGDDRHGRGRVAGSEDAADRDADARKRGRAERVHERSDDRLTMSPPEMTAPTAIPMRRHGRDHDDPDQDRHAARDDPPGTRQRRRERSRGVRRSRRRPRHLRASPRRGPPGSGRTRHKSS